MPEIWIIAIVLIIAVVCGLGIFGGGIMLRWYLREVRRVAVAADPAEAIVTYPLA